MTEWHRFLVRVDFRSRGTYTKHTNAGVKLYVDFSSSSEMTERSQRQQEKKNKKMFSAQSNQGSPAHVCERERASQRITPVT